jgi:hypothetical protein
LIIFRAEQGLSVISRFDPDSSSTGLDPPYSWENQRLHVRAVDFENSRLRHAESISGVGKKSTNAPSRLHFNSLLP